MKAAHSFTVRKEPDGRYRVCYKRGFWARWNPREALDADHVERELLKRGASRMEIWEAILSANGDAAPSPPVNPTVWSLPPHEAAIVSVRVWVSEGGAYGAEVVRLDGIWRPDERFSRQELEVRLRRLGVPAVRIVSAFAEAD